MHAYSCEEYTHVKRKQKPIIMNIYMKSDDFFMEYDLDRLSLYSSVLLSGGGALADAKDSILPLLLVMSDAVDNSSESTSPLLKSVILQR